jgi:hypothetical protein
VYRQNFPDIVATALTAPNSYSYATTLRLGLPNVTPPNISSRQVPVPLTAGLFTVDNNNFVRGYVQSWNFTIEQRIKGWIASAGCVATRSVDPASTLSENWGPIGAGTAGGAPGYREDGTHLGQARCRHRHGEHQQS